MDSLQDVLSDDDADVTADDASRVKKSFSDDTDDDEEDEDVSSD